MATKTIGQLSTATSITDADLIEIEQSGVSKSISAGFLIPTGVTLPFAGASAPTGWLICDGSAVSRTTYVNLFVVLSTTWGVGDGSLTFNIPDMREKVPVGIGTSGTLITSTGSAVSANDVYTLAQFKDDQEQGHFHGIASPYTAVPLYRASGGAGGIGAGTTVDNTGGAIRNPITDTVNGTPRTGTTTRGKRVGVNYIIKY
jgi:hypothetical protein